MQKYSKLNCIPLQNIVYDKFKLFLSFCAKLLRIIPGNNKFFFTNYIFSFKHKEDFSLQSTKWKKYIVIFHFFGNNLADFLLNSLTLLTIKVSTYLFKKHRLSWIFLYKYFCILNMNNIFTFQLFFMISP